MQSAFGAAPQELLINNDTGRNATLARLHGQYEAKAEWLSLLGKRPHRDGMYYERSAGAIGTLQMQHRVILADKANLFVKPQGEKDFVCVGEVTNVMVSLA